MELKHCGEVPAIGKKGAYGRNMSIIRAFAKSRDSIVEVMCRYGTAASLASGLRIAAKRYSQIFNTTHIRVSRRGERVYLSKENERALWTRQDAITPPKAAYENNHKVSIPPPCKNCKGVSI